MSDEQLRSLSKIRLEILTIAARAGRTRISEWRLTIRGGGRRVDARMLGLGGPGLGEERLLIAQSDDGGYVLTHCAEDLAHELEDHLRPDDDAPHH